MPGGWTRTASTPCPASSGTDNHPRLQQSEGGFEADCDDVAMCRAGGRRGRTWMRTATGPRMTPRTSASSQRQDEDHNQQQEEEEEGEKDLTLGCLTSPGLLLTSSACLSVCLPTCLYVQVISVYYLPCLFSKAGKAVVCVLYATFLAIGIYGLTQLQARRPPSPCDHQPGPSHRKSRPHTTASRHVSAKLQRAPSSLPCSVSSRVPHSLLLVWLSYLLCLPASARPGAPAGRPRQLLPGGLLQHRVRARRGGTTSVHRAQGEGGAEDERVGGVKRESTVEQRGLMLCVPVMCLSVCLRTWTMRTRRCGRRSEASPPGSPSCR